MIASVAMAPLIMAPSEELALVQRASSQFKQRLAIDNALVEGVSLVAKGNIELGNLEDIPASSCEISVGKSEYSFPLAFEVIDQDSETSPQAALIALKILGEDDQTLKEIELCIAKKK